MGLIDNFRNKYVIKPLADYLRSEAKRQNEAGVEKAGGFANNPSGAYIRDQLMWGSQYYQYGSTRSKPGASVDYVTLRRFSEQYDVVRAVINRRKRQLTQLEWDIVTIDPDAKPNPAKVREIRNKLDDIFGYRVRFREGMDTMTEDLLVLDALAIYKQPNRGGGLYALRPIDASTIQLRVDETGGTPMPPEVAFRQVIRGKTVNEYTADEMYYEMMNPRTSSPYGLSPMESLILTVSTALKSDLYNLHMLTEGNIPEGYVGLPDTWQPDQIKEFQELWDAALSGDSRATSRLKFGPEGQYTRFVKPEDMRYKELQEWLMKKTCMLYEIQPQELGFTDTVNKSTGEVQDEIGERSGLRPLAKFYEELFADIVQIDLGYTDYKFKFMGLDDEDAKAVAEVDQIRVNSGLATIDEIRAERGKEPLGIDKPFVMGSPTFIDADSIERRNAAAEALINMGATSVQTDQEDATPGATSTAGSQQTPTDENGDGTQAAPGGNTDNIANAADPVDRHVQLVTEMRAFRKYALARKSAGRPMRYFKSEILPEAVNAEMNSRLQKAKDVGEVRAIFKEYMADYQVKFLADVANLQADLTKVLK